MSARLWVTGLVWLLGTAEGQQASARHEAPGAVSGHVYSADTNLPARFASVTLQPVEIALQKKEAEPVRISPLTIYETLLDGSFLVPRVKPGTYYVVVQKLGYLSPIFQFKPEELAKPSAEL